MGVTLGRGGEGFSWSGGGWRFIQYFAMDNGWEPQGTIDPAQWDENSPEGWDGNYASNDGQLVTASDALNLARALAHGLEADPRALDLTEEERNNVLAFVKFCSAGEFTIF